MKTKVKSKKVSKEVEEAPKKKKVKAKGKKSADSDNGKKEVAIRPEVKAFASRIKKEYGPVTAIRAVAQKYPKLERKDVIAHAEAVGINPGTAATQFHLSRSGQAEIDLDDLK